MKSRVSSSVVIASFAALLLAQLPASAAVTVLTVPWVPATPTTPHTTYPMNSTTEATIILGATAPTAVGSSDSFTVSWNFGDGSAPTTFPLTNPYDISTTHNYPVSAATGTQWTAVVTVTDTTTNQTGSAKYYVIQEGNNSTDVQKSLASRVNVAIDWGLWYMHQTMWRNTATVGTKTITWGGWDTQNYSCQPVNGAAYDCAYQGVINAENLQAFEVNGHLQNGPSSDPYTEDVARGFARMLNFLISQPVAPNTYNFNPATATYTCKDGSYPTTTDPTCTSHGGQYFYNPSAGSCKAPPCTYTFDGNQNGQMVYSNDGSGYTIYTTAPFIDALVASGTPAAVANTGPAGIEGETYKNLIQDMIDWYAYSQYEYDYDVTQGYTRGTNQSQGGAWLYGPQQGDDNSTSQWAAIAFISAQRGVGVGVTVPPIVTDANQTWVTKRAGRTGCQAFWYGPVFFRR